MIKHRLLLSTIALIVFSLVMSGCGIFGPKTGDVSGVVTWDDGEPVVGAQIKAGDETTTTGSDGSYKLEKLRHGSHELTVTIQRQVVATEKITIDETPAIVNIEIVRPEEPIEATQLVLIRSELTESATANYPEYGNYMDALIDFLDGDYEFDVISHQDVIDGQLAGAKLAILNDQGVMNDADIAAIREFVQGGGKILATYSTSIRNTALENVGFQLADLFGVRWETWTHDATFDKMVIVNDHPMLKDYDGEIPVGAANRHKVIVDDATVLAVRADEDGNYEEGDGSAVLTMSDAGVYVGFSLLGPRHFDDEAGAELIHTIINYFAPEARI